MRYRWFDWLRLLAGLFLVPPSSGVIGVLTYDAMWHLGLFPAGAPMHSFDAARSLGLGITLLGTLMTLAGAVLAVLWSIKAGGLSVPRLVVLGAVLGNAPFTVIVVVVVLAALLRGEYLGDAGRYWDGFGGAIVRILLGSITGVGSALIFWVIVVVGRCSTPRQAGRRRAAWLS